MKKSTARQSHAKKIGGLKEAPFKSQPRLTAESPTQICGIEDVYGHWERAVLVGNYDTACQLDFAAYNSYVKPTESLEAWNYWQELTGHLRSKIANYYLDAFPSYPQVGNGRLAVVYHNYSGLAHEVQFGRQLKKVLADDNSLFSSVVYAFGSPVDPRPASQIFGIPEDNVVFLSSNSYQHAALSLESHIKQNEIGTVVFPSIVFLCFWVSLFCRHGNQKFFQMKYFPRQIGRISEWAGCDDGGSHPKRVVLGEEFTKLPIDLEGLPLVQGSPTTSRVEPVERPLRLGSISRIEKIQNPAFAAFILEVLSAFPRVQYIITGRPTDVSRIPERLRSHPGVRFVGWVNPLLFIREIDIYLDPWPWGGGDMSFLAMVNEIPYLTLSTTDGFSVGPLATIHAMVRKSSVTYDLKQFIPNESRLLFSALSRLITDQSLRCSVGKLWAKACGEYGSGDKIAWRRFLFE